MPFAAPLIDENDPNKKNQQNGVNISGQSTSFATNVPGQEAGNSPKGKGSGQYANIQSYLDANKDQADQMGQKITTNVAKEADDATAKVQEFSAKAPTVQAYDPNEAIKKATALSDQEKAQYKEVKKTGGYTGPATVDGVSGYQDAQKAASSAAQNVQNAGTETGQQQLLKQTYARPQYSAGENRLDQVLLQNSAGSRANLENLSQKYAGIDKMFSDASTSVGDAINKANTQALANRNAFIPAEKAARDALINPIQKRVDEYNSGRDAYIDRIIGDAGDEILSEETLKALGLSEGGALYDVNLANYITPNRTQAGLNNLATADERQKYAALASLFDDQTMSQINDNGKALNAISLDKDQLGKDIHAKRIEVEDIINNRLDAVDGKGGLYSNNYKMTPQQAIAQLQSYLTQGGEGMDPAKIQAKILANQKVIDDAKIKYGYDRKVKKG